MVAVVTDLLTADAAARALGLSSSVVRRIARRDGVGRRIGRDWLFAAADLAALRAGIRSGAGKRGRPARHLRLADDGTVTA